MLWAAQIRYAIREYALGRANEVCENAMDRANAFTRIRYGPREYDMQYANRLRAMNNCKVAFSATIHHGK